MDACSTLEPNHENFAPKINNNNNQFEILITDFGANSPYFIPTSINNNLEPIEIMIQSKDDNTKFKGFLISARKENNRNSSSSFEMISGIWSEFDEKSAKILECPYNSDTSNNNVWRLLTHSSSEDKSQVLARFTPNKLRQFDSTTDYSIRFV